MSNTAAKPNVPTATSSISSATSAPTTESLAVLRNTYRLLGLSVGFAAFTAGVSAMLKLPHPGLIITLVGYFGLLFVTHHFKNSGWGLVSVFALTGFMGYTLGPILAMYLTLTNGATLVTLAAGTTAAAFFGLSMIARRTDVFDTLKFGNFLFIGILTAFLLGLGAVFFQIPALSLAVSGLFVLLMSGLIMYETQNILRGGETNYIMATVTLFVSVYNLFTSLLHLLGAFAGEDA